MNNKTSLLLLSMLIASTPALARIGETPEQCQARYGEPVKKLSNNRSLFQKNGILIIAEFYEGKADLLTFRKVDQNIIGIPADFSDNEIAGLLKANGGEKAWKKVESLSLDSQWQTDDSALIANYASVDKLLFIVTKNHMAHSEENKKKKEDKNLSEF